MDKEYHILHNISSGGKEVKWSDYKINSLRVANSLKRIGEFKRATNIYFCGTDLRFYETVDGRLKLFEANFCKDRLCYMCTWRRSLKVFGQTQKLMNFMKTKGSFRYIFLTLTVRNCPGDSLRSTISDMIIGCTRMQRLKVLKGSILGYIRNLEVTFNVKTKEFHPHLHIILCVPSDYFGKKYIKQSVFSDCWRQSMRLDYYPICHVQVVKKELQENAVAEIAKYPVKMDNILKLSDSDLDYPIKIFSQALKGVRLIEYYGNFRRFRRELKLDDVDSGDLINTNLGSDSEILGVIHQYQWRFGCYISND